MDIKLKTKISNTITFYFIDNHFVINIKSDIFIQICFSFLLKIFVFVKIYKFYIISYYIKQ